MQIANFLPGLFKDPAEEIYDREAAKSKGPRNGPQRQRWITAGQQRRRAVRDRASQARKATRRHRREYMQGRLALAVLRGQLQAVKALPLRDGLYRADVDPKIYEILVDSYGSVEQAKAAYDTLTAPRR